MMSDPTTVDKTLKDERTGKLVLVIQEDRPWREPEVMHRQLAAKVKNYVRYVRSQQFARKHGQPKETAIWLVTTHSPSPATQKLLERIGYELGKHGIGFEHRMARPRPTRAPSAERSTPEEPPDSGAPKRRPPQPTERPGPAAGEAESPADATEPPLGRERSDPGAERGAEPRAEPTPPEPGRRASGGADRPPGVPAAGHDEARAEPVGRAMPPHGVDGPELEGRELPPHWPEEEFGRHEEMEEAAASAQDDDLWLEMPETVTDSEAEPAAARATYKPEGGAGESSLRRALAAAMSSAVAGSLLWWGLGIVSGQSARSLEILALVVSGMVGFAVRIHGAGRSVVYRIIAGIGTALGCGLGGLLTAAWLAAKAEGTGFGGMIVRLSSLDAVIGTMTATYTTLDLAVLAAAVVLGFRFAAPRDTGGSS